MAFHPVMSLSEVLELAGLASGDPFMAASRAQALARLSRPGEALQAAREALQLAEAQALEPDPLEIQLNRSDLLWDLAQLAERNGDLQLALYYLKRHLKLTPSTESWKHYEALQLRLRELSGAFFAQDLDAKLRIRMALGGRAWRGYFPVGDELTSGKPDQKEGLYFGTEVPADHPLVQAGAPLHGPNLFPDHSSRFLKRQPTGSAE